MASLSPPTVVVDSDPYYDPYYGTPVVVGTVRHSRRGYRAYRSYGQVRSEIPNEFTDEPFQQTECGYEQDVDEGEPEEQYEEEQEGGGEEFGDPNEMPSERQVRAQYLKDCAAHPLATADHKFEKLLCNSCSGHTITLDGKPHEHLHAESCIVMKTGAAAAATAAKAATKEKKIGCAECGGKGKHHHIVVVPPPEVVDCSPPPPACPKKPSTPPTVIQLQPQEDSDCEDESSTESDCEEEVEEDVCAKPSGSGTVVEVYMDDEASLGKKLMEAQSNNKSIRAIFNKKIFAKDGKSAMEVKCCVTTNVVDSQGRPSFSLGMTPVLRSSSKTQPAMISANLWTVDAKAKRLALNVDAARQFYDAGVQKEVLSSVVAHVESALNKAKK